MDNKNNNQFDSLFRDFFNQDIHSANNHEKQPVPKSHFQDKIEDDEDIDNLVSNLLLDNKAQHSNIDHIVADLITEQNTPISQEKGDYEHIESSNLSFDPNLEYTQSSDFNQHNKLTEEDYNEQDVINPNELLEEEFIERGEDLKYDEQNNIEGGSSEFVVNPEFLAPHSQEVDEILSYVPNWLIRWGITAIFFVMFSIVIMSYFIKYPDTVEGHITITSNTPPATIIVKSNGTLELFKKDKEIVKKDEVLALIKNDADYEDVKKLKDNLKTLKSRLDRRSRISTFKFDSRLDLGNLQNSFSELVFSLKSQQVQSNSRNDDYYRKSNIDEQIAQIKTIKQEQNQQIKILQLEYSRLKETYDKRYKPMFANGSISAEQLDNKLSEVNQRQTVYQNAKTSLSEYQKRILDLEAQKNELDYNGKQISNETMNAISIAYSRLANDITAWENLYLITAPIGGRLNYLQFVKNNSNAKIEQEIASVVPILAEDQKQSNEIMGELFINAADMGKIKLNQVTNVELDAYLKKEYGAIKGEVLEIADVGTRVSDNSGSSVLYKILINFEDGLKTTSGKEILFKHNMNGRAEIITEDVRLIERIFNELREVVNAE